jgi:hypothetical protein
MKLLQLLTLLIICCSAMLGQQQQASQSASKAPAFSSTQPSQLDQPFLHGEQEFAGPLGQSESASGPGDIRGRLESLKSYLGSRRGLIEIPPNAAAGWWEGMGASNIRFFDDRGNSLPTSMGVNSTGSSNGAKTGYNNALLIRATETEPSSSERYTGFINLQLHYAAAQGGFNNYNGKSGTKTDYINLLATSEMRTVGQKTGIGSVLSSFSNGDTMGIETNITQYGGYDTSGDEQTEGVRVQIQQGSAGALDSGGIFEGVATAISRNKLTYSAKRDERTLGEHRIIRDLDRSYGFGTILSVANSGGSPNTVKVTGNGTHWSELGVRGHTLWNNLAVGGGVTQTNLVFCFDPLKSDGYDMCFPVSEINDDSHLTLNMIAYGTAWNTSWPSTWPVAGRYRRYGAAWSTEIDIANHTITAPDLSGIQSGHRIDQVLAYNTQTIGQWICMSRHTGIPGKGGGVLIWNWGTAESPEMGFGVGVSGAFESAIAFQDSNQKSGVPIYFAKFFSEPGSKILFDSSTARNPSPQVALWRLKDSAGAAHVMLSFFRDTATTCVLDSSLCVSAGGSVAAKRIGQLESNDYAGTVKVAGGTSATANFKQPFRSIPVCTLTPTSDPSDLGAYWVSSSSSSVTVHVRRAGDLLFNYMCVGNPD